MFPRNTDLVSTRYCTTSIKGGVTTQKRLIACPARNGKDWCVRSQTQCFDNEGGGEQSHPFSYTALIKDAFHQYRDYTLTKTQAMAALKSFENGFPFGGVGYLQETHVDRQMMKDALQLHLY